MRLFSTLVLASLVALGACGPSISNPGDGDDDPTGDGGVGPDAYQGQLANLSGTVWMPNYSPSLAPAGTEPIPVFGAVIYLSSVRPAPIPQQVYCERCIDAPSNARYSSHDGSFTLTAVPGTYWLVIQKGQWRLEQQITVAAGDLALTEAQTTLPHVLDPDAGQWIPKIGIALGTNDKIEDVLGKVGFDSMSGNNFMDVPGSGITVFPQSGGARTLIGSLDQLRQFHIVFFPCNTSIDDFGMPELANQAALDNLRRYVNEGGKLYVTDWSGEVMDRPFPPQIKLGGGVDSVGTYDPINFGGTLTTLGSANGGSYTSPDGEAVDPDLNAWLGLQMAPSPGNPVPSLIDANRFAVQGNFNWIEALDSTIQTGMDPEGLPIYDVPKAWVIGSRPADPGVKRPLSVSFEPTGCGRVLFSTYQTADSNHAGLHPQERVLLFLIAEIGVCSSGPIVD